MADPRAGALRAPFRPGLFETRQPFILASASPRRRQLLEALGLLFEVSPSGVEERAVPGLPTERVCVWARDKVEAVSVEHPGHWVLGADTIVVLGGTIFGKPGNPEDAGKTLHQLSGRDHEVISGICLVNRSRGHLQTLAVRTQVRFKTVTAAEISAYVATGEPLDKAGSYGIQGLGAFLVQSIHGSYTNVVGLPLAETVDWLLRQAVIAPRKDGPDH